MDDNTKLEEVKPLKEPERAPEHCGKRMRRMSNVTPFGKLLTVYVCDKCGVQQRPPEPPKDLTAKAGAPVSST